MKTMKALKNALFGDADSPPSQGAPAAEIGGGMQATEALAALRAQLSKMSFAAADERSRANTLRRELDRLEKEKHAAIALARLHDVEADVTDMNAQIECARQAIKDAEGAAAELESMRAREVERLPYLEHDALRELTHVMDQRFATHAGAYSACASKLAAAALELMAWQELMFKTGAGNSNGFDRFIVIPAAKPGEGATLKPILHSGNRECTEAVTRRSEELANELRAVGFSL